MIPDAFYALDTETTGLNAKIGHRIMEIAIVKVVGDQRTRYHRYINPDREPDAESLRVHGITSEMVEDMPQFHEIADEVLVVDREPTEAAMLGAGAFAAVIAGYVGDQLDLPTRERGEIGVGDHVVRMLVVAAVVNGDAHVVQGCVGARHQQFPRIHQVHGARHAAPEKRIQKKHGVRSLDLIQ